MAKLTYKLKGTDTTIITYEDADDEFRVIGSDEHGFFEALTSEHELGDLAAPLSDPPIMTTRLPVNWRDYDRVISLHCLRVGLDEANIEFRREP